MKTQRKTKNSSSQIEAKKLTLGDLILATYAARGKQGSRKILQLAFGSQLVRFIRPPLLG